MLKDKAINNIADIDNQSKAMQPSRRGKVKPFFEEYYSVISGKKEILNTRKLDLLCEYLLKCSQTCDSTAHVSQYLKSPDAPFKVEVRTLDNWLHKYPQLNDAYNELMEAIGDKLREKVLKSEIPPVLIHKDLNLYCDRYKKLFKWEQELKNKDSNKSGDVNITMTTIPNSPLVPALEVKEDE